jgi:hypothetical protein
MSAFVGIAAGKNRYFRIFIDWRIRI